MNFDDFMKNPKGFQLDLSSYDSKNSFGTANLSNQTIWSFQSTISNFDIDRINLDSKEALQQAQLLIMYKKVLSEVVDLIKKIPSDYIANAPRTEVNTITSQALLDKLVDNNQPLQIFKADEGFVAHIGKELKEKLNFSGEYAEFQSFRRHTPEIEAEQKIFKFDLGRSFLRDDSLMHGTFSNMSKIIEADPSLREFFVKNQKTLENPINFNANMKKIDIANLPQLNLSEVFGNNPKLAEILDKNNAISSVLVKNPNLEQDFSKILPVVGTDSLMQLFKELEKLSQLLQLNEKASLLLTDAISKPQIVRMGFDIGGQKEANSKLLDSGLFSNVLSKDEEKEVSMQTKEKFIDAPRKDEPTEFLKLSSPYDFSKHLDADLKISEKTDIKQSNTSDLSQNISTAFKNDDDMGLKL